MVPAKIYIFLEYCYSGLNFYQKKEREKMRLGNGLGIAGAVTAAAIGLAGCAAQELKQKEIPVYNPPRGCAGIGRTECLQGSVEQCRDTKGIAVC